jgi:hypothetical protein
MKPFTRAGLLASCLAVAVLAACEDLPAGPDLDALVEARGRAGGAGLSLQDLFAVAVVRLQRTEGSDTAAAVLSRWREVRETSPGDTVATGEADSVLRELEAAVVVRAFGAGVADQARAVVNGELQQLRPQAQELSGAGRDAATIAAILDSADVALTRANQLRRSDPAAALVQVAIAAEQVSGLRTALADLERFPTLEELHDRAMDNLRAAGRHASADSFALAVHSLDEEARLAATAGGVEASYSALGKARMVRAAVVVEGLGMDAVNRLLLDLRETASNLRSTIDARPSQDLAREQRMLAAAIEILGRADTAAAEGDPVRAVDLATHSAGLLNELRRQLVR